MGSSPLPKSAHTVLRKLDHQAKWFWISGPRPRPSPAPRSGAQPHSSAHSPPRSSSPPPRALVTRLASTGWAMSWCTSSPAGQPILCAWSCKTGKAMRPMPSMSTSSWAVRGSYTGGLRAQAGGWTGHPGLVVTESAPKVSPWAFPVPTICPPFGRTSQDLQAAVSTQHVPATGWGRVSVADASIL